MWRSPFLRHVGCDKFYKAEFRAYTQSVSYFINMTYVHTHSQCHILWIWLMCIHITHIHYQIFRLWITCIHTFIIIFYDYELRAYTYSLSYFMTVNYMHTHIHYHIFKLVILEYFVVVRGTTLDCRLRTRPCRASLLPSLHRTRPCRTRPLSSRCKRKRWEVVT